MQVRLGVSQTTNLWDLVWYLEHLITRYYFLLGKFEAFVISYVGLPYNLKGQIDPLISIPTYCLIPWHIPEYPNVASRTKFHKIKKETLARLSDMYPRAYLYLLWWKKFHWGSLAIPLCIIDSFCYKPSISFASVLGMTCQVNFLFSL